MDGDEHGTNWLESQLPNPFLVHSAPSIPAFTFPHFDPSLLYFWDPQTHFCQSNSYLIAPASFMFPTWDEIKGRAHISISHVSTPHSVPCEFRIESNHSCPKSSKVPLIMKVKTGWWEIGGEGTNLSPSSSGGHGTTALGNMQDQDPESVVILKSSQVYKETSFAGEGFFDS